MPRKSTGTPGEPEDTTVVSRSPPSQTQNIQATEQQLKARAEGGVSIEDYLLPRSLTLRLAKSVLPPNTSIQKDAVLALQKAATVFVSYLSSHANEATLKRTVAPSDVFNAISELEFDSFRSRLEKELDAFTELKAGKRRAKKGGEHSDGAGEKGVTAAATGQGEEGGEEEEEEEEEADDSRGAKRVKRGTGADENMEEGKKEKKGDEVEEDDDEETQDERDTPGDENETEEEDEGEEDDEEEEEERADEDDIDRVEDLDLDSRARRTMDPDAGDETESDEEAGPGGQLRGDFGMG